MNWIWTGSIEHARQQGGFSQINSTPERLDLSAEILLLPCRWCKSCGIDRRTQYREFGRVRNGPDHPRRAALTGRDVMQACPEANCAIS